jgi:hypothetical protein
MVQHGSTATVSIGGTSTAFTAEAMTLFSGSGDTAVWQITSATKQLWNPEIAVVVNDDGNPLTEGTDFEVESYLYGRIRLLGYTLIDPSPTVDGEYLPLLTVDRASQYTLEVTNNLSEVPRMDSTQCQRRITGLTDVTFSLSRWEMGLHDYDPGAGSKRFGVLAGAGTTIFIEFTFGTSAGGARLACLIDSDNITSSVNDPVQAQLQGMVASVKAGADFSLSATASA